MQIAWGRREKRNLTTAPTGVGLFRKLLSLSPLFLGLLFLEACAKEDVARTPAAPEKPDIGKWRLEHRNDPVSGAQVATASLHISRYQFLAGTYEGELQLMCFKNRPVIRLVFNLRIGSDKTTALAYRIDENPGRYVNSKFFARERTIVIDNKNEVADFASQLQSAQSLFLRVTRLRAGTFTAKFPVHGASHAMEAAFADCPVTDKPKARTS